MGKYKLLYNIVIKDSNSNYFSIEKRRFVDGIFFGKKEKKE